MANKGLPLALFTTEDGKTQLRLRLQDDTLWLTQRQLAELYEKALPTINEHLKNIYEEAELKPEATIRKFRIVAREGARDVERLLDHYSLEAVLAVGYRVRSNRGMQFRQWATQVLQEYLIKGFVMDDERLKNPDRDLGVDYYDELLERIRDIRASERRFYQKITDIYAMSVDYRSNAATSQTFFATVQNKLHWAVHGHTAAELIHQRADSRKPNMGLSNWSGGRVSKQDVSIAKNYLNKNELDTLNRIVTMYLDFAELRAVNREPMTMQQWAEKLDAFLAFNEQDILKDAGKVSHEVASALAEQEFFQYEQSRRYSLDSHSSDFDQLVKQSKKLPKKEP